MDLQSLQSDSKYACFPENVELTLQQSVCCCVFGSLSHSEGGTSLFPWGRTQAVAEKVDELGFLCSGVHCGFTAAALSWADKDHVVQLRCLCRRTSDWHASRGNGRQQGAEVNAWDQTLFYWEPLSVPLRLLGTTTCSLFGYFGLWHK